VLEEPSSFASRAEAELAMAAGSSDPVPAQPRARCGRTRSHRPRAGEAGDAASDPGQRHTRHRPADAWMPMSTQQRLIRCPVSLGTNLAPPALSALTATASHVIADLVSAPSSCQPPDRQCASGEQRLGSNFVAGVACTTMEQRLPGSRHAGSRLDADANDAHDERRQSHARFQRALTSD
jgi:hypothetical protein